MKHTTKLFLSWLTVIAICISYNCSNKPQKLRVGYLPIGVGLPLFVATDEGYFKEQGFEVEMNPFASSDEAADAGTRGTVDVFTASTNVVLDIGNSAGKKHTLVIPNLYSNQPGHIADYILVKDTNSIRRIEDLKGKRIGVFPGTVIKVLYTLIFQKYGLSKDDYTVVDVAPKDWYTALKIGHVDALTAIEPVASMIMHDKRGFPVVNGFYAQLMPDVPLSAQWISEDFVKKNGKVQAEKIIAAIDKAIDFINTNPEKAKLYYVKYAHAREDILSMVQLNPWHKHDQTNTVEIQNFIDLLYKNGLIKNHENINDYLLK